MPLDHRLIAIGCLLFIALMLLLIADTLGGDMKRVNAQNMTWIDTRELAAKNATIKRLTRERNALLEYAKDEEAWALECWHCGCDDEPCQKHKRQFPILQRQRRAAIALCEE